MYRDIMRNIEKVHLLRRLFITKTFKAPQQIAMLRFIYENPDCTQADIAKYFHVSSATVAVSTKKLQKSGFIKKTVEECNLRCKRISITEYGEKEFFEIQKKFDEHDKIIFDDFTEDELKYFLECLHKINSKMENIEGIECSDEHTIAEIINRLCQDNENSDE